MLTASLVAGCTADSAGDFKPCRAESDGPGVFGRVLDGFGEQVPGAQVTLQVNASVAYRASLVTDSVGCFADDTPAGRLAVQCDKAGRGADRRNVTVVDGPVEANCLLSTR